MEFSVDDAGFGVLRPVTGGGASRKFHNVVVWAVS